MTGIVRRTVVLVALASLTSAACGTRVSREGAQSAAVPESPTATASTQAESGGVQQAADRSPVGKPEQSVPESSPAATVVTRRSGSPETASRAGQQAPTSAGAVEGQRGGPSPS